MSIVGKVLLWQDYKTTHVRTRKQALFPCPEGLSDEVVCPLACLSARDVLRCNMLSFGQ